jgi:hypothetical protein
MRQFDSIPELLKANIARELILSVEDAFAVGARRAYSAAQGMDEGHLPHVVGQLRHFHLNETFQQTLSTNHASPSPIKGSGIVTGRAGIFTLARFNSRDALWNSARRSQTRRQMALANRAIEPLVQPELFFPYTPPTDAVVFFVACFAGSLSIQPDSPVSIQLAVPDRHLQKWLFRESLETFIQRYDASSAIQDDFAHPKLKKNFGKQIDKDGTTS